MKRVLTTSIALSAFSAAFAATFTPGNLVITKVGDGVTALAATATPVFLVEMTPAGTIVQTIPMPTTGASQFTCRGTSTSEVHLNVNDNKFTFAGYDAAVGTADPSVASNLSTDATPMRRVVAVVDMNGNIDTTTRMVDTNSKGSIRSAIIKGNDIWISGTNGAAAADFLTSGIRYATLGASFSTGITDTASGNLTNMRNIGIFDGQLYVGSFSGTTYNGINAVGTGLPTIGVQPLVNKVNTAAGGSPASVGCYDFIFTGNALYAASDQSAALGGLVKWTTADGGATWTYQYTILNAASTGFRSLTLSGSTFFLTGTNGRVYTGQDLGATSTFTEIAANPANTQYRGIKVVPASSAATISGSVDLNGYVGTAPGSANVTLQFSILDANTNAVLQGPTNVSVTPSGGSATYTLNVNSGISGSVKVVGDGATWLKKTINTSVGATNANINLLNGNCVDDSVVDLSDYTVVAVAFNGIFGAAPYDAAADVNKDGIVDLTDYTIVVTNFNAVDN